VRRGARPVLLAILHRHETGAGTGAAAAFTDRLVVKFGLPVTGWRGRQEALAPGAAAGGRAAPGAEEASQADA
jgi:NAD+ kinase